MSQPLERWTVEQLRELVGDCSLTTEALKTEASHRRFFRVTVAPGQSFVVMDSPPAQENNQQFVRLAEVFIAAGVPVPEILTHDFDLGYFLMTDLGLRDLEAAYATEDRTPAIQSAIRTLAAIQQVRSEHIEPYTRERFEMELTIFTEWFVRGLMDTRVPAEAARAFQHLCDTPGEQIQCCVHRDYHCRNLLYDEQGGFGVVDFQDALMGPVAYDLASLLHDCYYEFEAAEITHWQDRFVAESNLEVDGRRLARDVDFCAVQRQLKAIGIFSRLQLSRARSSHLVYISPLLSRIARLCFGYPELDALGSWVESMIPPARAALDTLAKR